MNAKKVSLCLVAAALALCSSVCLAQEMRTPPGSSSELPTGFMIEGLLYGLGGAALAIILVGFSYNVLLKGIAARNIYNPWVINLDLMMSNLAIILFVLGGLIGIIASLIAVGKHLESDVYHPPHVPKGVSAW